MRNVALLSEDEQRRRRAESHERFLRDLEAAKMASAASSHTVFLCCMFYKSVLSLFLSDLTDMLAHYVGSHSAFLLWLCVLCA